MLSSAIFNFFFQSRCWLFYSSALNPDLIVSMNKTSCLSCYSNNSCMFLSTLATQGCQCQMVKPSRRFRLKYPNNFCMDCKDIQYRHTSLLRQTVSVFIVPWYFIIWCNCLVKIQMCPNFWIIRKSIFLNSKAFASSAPVSENWWRSQ